ncbi:MAG: retroviral-like aspartic protease family protein [Saprospiraceae bacterium]|nr:retroviral-like aspartic protease family protein [Saprospiraceae bacterium]
MKQGFVSDENFYVEIPFTYEKGFIFIPVQIQGKSYNFLLDTGAELTLIDQAIVSELSLKTLKKGVLSNAKSSSKGNERVEIDKIDIGGIEFHSPVSFIWDISKFAKYIRCEKIDGIIGNNLMRKANWQIDYQNLVIRITDNIEKMSVSNDAKRVKMNAGDVGNVYLELDIDGKKIPFTFDTGFNGFAQTGHKALIKKAAFTKVGLKGVNFLGSREGETHFLKLQNFKINDYSFPSPSYLLIKPNNSSVLGNEFYKNYTITIDWSNDYLIFDKNKDSALNEPVVYEVSLFTDYEKGIIIISSIQEGSSLIDKIKPQLRVLKINNVDLVELERKGGICTFWSKEWKNIKTSEILNITIEQDGIQQEIEVKKIKN